MVCALTDKQKTVANIPTVCGGGAPGAGGGGGAGGGLAGHGASGRSMRSRPEVAGDGSEGEEAGRRGGGAAGGGAGREGANALDAGLGGHCCVTTRSDTLENQLTQAERRSEDHRSGPARIGQDIRFVVLWKSRDVQSGGLAIQTCSKNSAHSIE